MVDKGKNSEANTLKKDQDREKIKVNKHYC